MSIQDIIATDLSLINGLEERLSPSLQRAAGDILKWFLEYAKVIIAADSLFLPLRRSMDPNEWYSTATQKYAGVLNALKKEWRNSRWKIDSEFTYLLVKTGLD